MNVRWYKALEAFHERGVIMQHNAWQPVLDAYKVPVWAVLESQHHDENIRPHQLEKALEQLHTHPDALLWGNRRHANRALEWLHQHQQSGHATLVYFDPLGDCGATWLQLMQANLDLLEKASTP
jgi:ABC-type Zn uptake system ZnuABC Zn-binding protein ZnuA